MREAPGVLRVSTIEEAREQARAALELIHKWRQREQAWDTPRALDFERIGVSIRALLDATEPPETREAVEPMRDADGDMISSGEHRKISMSGDGFFVCDTCTNVLGLNVRWDHASKREDHQAAVEPLPPKPAEDEREALRFTPELRADLVAFARVRIQAVWDDVGETDAATLAQNVVLAQEFAWLSMHFPTKGPRPITDEMVDAAAGADFEFGKESMTWADWGRANPEHAEWLRTKARAILEAAEGARR